LSILVLPHYLFQEASYQVSSDGFFLGRRRNRILSKAFQSFYVKLASPRKLTKLDT